MSTVTKSHIAAAVASSAGCDHRNALRLVDLVLETIKDTLGSGEHVFLSAVLVNSR